jgi:hypothetical protein
MADTSHVYELEERELSPVDLINRRAAATGSIQYAAASEHGDYNGHPVRVGYRPHAVGGARWTAEYTWAGRCVLARGSFKSCLRAAVDYYERGARGASVCVVLDSNDPGCPLDEQIAYATELGLKQREGDPWWKGRPSWWTPRHQIVSDAMGWESSFGGITSFALNHDSTDWEIVRDDFLMRSGKTPLGDARRVYEWRNRRERDEL